ncbi:GDSL esterase/lipase 5-like [Nicotiana tabacum]|uniref:GDSL esterase/lipase 5-like n=2 Tax=Nicotiana TaxID=4085 RepID=A0A1S3YQY5_TOBAC|nr:PREDICTED: GDSL esterase/lipase 5-like [Nicotiana sylvestris]
MAFSNNLFFGCCLIVFAFLLGSPIEFVEGNIGPFPALFVFGDSILDSGNNNYINTTTQFQANFPPYGETFFKSPTGRPCDGRLISDFIAEFANLPLIPAYFEIGTDKFLHGVNFASSGSGCLVETNRGIVIDLPTQLAHFNEVVQLLENKLGQQQAQQLVADAVYMFSTGSNDYAFPYLSNPKFPFPKEEFSEMVLGNFTAILKEIYNKGGRKFTIFTLPPEGCSPGGRAFNEQANGTSGDCMQELNGLLQMHSSALPQKLNQLQQNLTGFNYTLFDLFKLFTERIDNPSKYGFKVSIEACCGTGQFRGINSCGGKRQVKEYELCPNATDHVFFDASHPTEEANRQFAELLWNGTTDVIAPHNLKSFFLM